jgi:hypothetical protein
MSLKDLIRGWLLNDQPEMSKVNRVTLGLQDSPPSTNVTRHFSIHAALNGNYIEFTRRKYNPHGPDDHMREVYLVQADESLIDAISTVLVLTEK